MSIEHIASIETIEGQTFHVILPIMEDSGNLTWGILKDPDHVQFMDANELDPETVRERMAGEVSLSLPERMDMNSIHFGQGLQMDFEAHTPGMENIIFTLYDASADRWEPEMQVFVDVIVHEAEFEDEDVDDYAPRSQHVLVFTVNLTRIIKFAATVALVWKAFKARWN